MELLEPTDAFTYFFHTTTYNKRDWSDAYHNLQKARQHWEIIFKVLNKMVATV